MISNLTTDWAWGGLGLTMATASAGFAGYMIVTAPADITGWGTKGFTVFVRWDKRNADPLATHLLPSETEDTTVAALAPPLKPEAEAAGSQAIDPTPTGSIAAAAAPDLTRAPQSSSETLAAFKLRNVVGDRALIEHGSRFTLVKPGSILAGAGEVLSIERQGQGWVVRTASGIIASGT